MKERIEHRTFAVHELRVTKKGDAPDGPKMIRGHAAVFNKDSEEMSGFVERVAPGAFGKTLKDGADVRALFNHDPNVVLGRSTSGTLRLFEDKIGLAIEIDPPDTQAARDLLVSIERGDISQMSFGFRTVTDDWQIEEKRTVRTLKEVELFDVSPVTFPAYPDTDVSARDLEAIAEEGRQRLAEQTARPFDASTARTRELEIEDAA